MDPTAFKLKIFDQLQWSWQLTNISLKVYMNHTYFFTFQFQDFCVAFHENPRDNSKTDGFQFQKPSVRPSYSVCYKVRKQELCLYSADMHYCLLKSTGQSWTE